MLSLCLCITLELASEIGIGRVDAGNGLLAVWDPESGVQGLLDFGEPSARAGRKLVSLLPVLPDRSRVCERCRMDWRWEEV